MQFTIATIALAATVVPFVASHPFYSSSSRPVPYDNGFAGQQHITTRDTGGIYSRQATKPGQNSKKPSSTLNALVGKKKPGLSQDPRGDRNTLKRPSQLLGGYDKTNPRGDGIRADRPSLSTKLRRAIAESDINYEEIIARDSDYEDYDNLVFVRDLELSY